jgi:Tfp pilus assembly protein PilN
MRSVNLIPPDERRGDSAPLRTGTLIYVLVAGLALFLLGIVAVALTSKQVSDRQGQETALEQQLQQETARANSLAPFAQFRALQESRAATMRSLAESRFDWNRVLRELALVVPENVSLRSLAGTASPSVEVDGNEQIELRASLPGPALEITGCAQDQKVVAQFVSSIEDIDGVTRVGLDNSSLASNASEGSSGTGGSSDCSKPLAYKFQVVVAFDKVPTPSTASTAPSVPSGVAPASSSDTSASSSDNSQVADGQSEEAVARADANVQTSKAQKAKSTLIPGG